MAPAEKKRKRTPLPFTRPTRSSATAVAAAAAAAQAEEETEAEASSSRPTTTPSAPAAEDSDDDAYHPAQALPPVSKKATAAFNSLAALPSARSAVGRTNKTLDLARPSNREAYLAQCVGVVSAAPCKSCRKGVGP